MPYITLIINILSIIKELLLKIINDIDTGNSNLSAKECEEVIDYLSFISNKNEKLSKYQGFKELFFYKKDLDKFKENN